MTVRETDSNYECERGVYPYGIYNYAFLYRGRLLYPYLVDSPHVHVFSNSIIWGVYFRSIIIIITIAESSDKKLQLQIQQCLEKVIRFLQGASTIIVSGCLKHQDPINASIEKFLTCSKPIKKEFTITNRTPNLKELGCFNCIYIFLLMS